MSERHTTSRNPRIEALRLVAIVGIAVFHTFQPWFAAITDGAWDASPLTRSALGCVSLLGAYGNHVFFLISGFFLVPRAVAEARDDGYWGAQAQAVVRRALPVLATVAIYAAIALAVSTWVVPMERVSLRSASWLVGGLQFIWVYLIVVALVPLVGWVWARLRRPRAVVCVIVCAVLLVNLYIAFVSPGDDVRELLEWRKLMSAVSYLAAFLVGGALSGLRLYGLARALLPLVVTSFLVEFAAGVTGNLRLLDALSFKSTSALSFALAVSSLAWAASSSELKGTGGTPGLLRSATQSILGFYVAQSLFTSLWHPLANEICLAALTLGESALIVAGVVVSAALLVFVVVFDQLVRVPLLRLMRLA